MAVAPLTLEDSLALGSTDLKFTFTKNAVEPDLQAKFFINKVGTGRLCLEGVAD